MAKGYWLTERDRDDLQELLRAFRSGAFAQPAKNKSHREFAAIQEISIGITAEAITAGGSGDVTRYTVTSGSFASASETVEAFDWFGEGIPSGERVALVRLAHKDGTRWVAIDPSGTVIGKAKWIEFTLPGALAVTDASIASATVDNYFQGTDPGATVTLWNKTASTNYLFSGVTGQKGYAVYDDRADKYRIVQLECG